jgi:hypothetical protein
MSFKMFIIIVDNFTYLFFSSLIDHFYLLLLIHLSYLFLKGLFSQLWNNWYVINSWNVLVIWSLKNIWTLILISYLMQLIYFFWVWRFLFRILVDLLAFPFKSILIFRTALVIIWFIIFVMLILLFVLVSSSN